MIRIERTHDMEWIRSVAAHPAVWPHMSGRADGAAEWIPADTELCHWLTPVGDDGERLGMILVHPHTDVCWEVHIGLLPCAWGPCASRVARAALAWVFSHTPCEKLITWVPAYNRPAMAFARRSGMVVEGLCRKSFRCNGQLVDQYLLGISKEAACQQQRQ